MKHIEAHFCTYVRRGGNLNGKRLAGLRVDWNRWGATSRKRKRKMFRQDQRSGNHFILRYCYNVTLNNP